MRTIYVLIFALFCTMFTFFPQPLVANSDSASTKINRGNELYLTGNFKEAIALYESVREEGFQNGYLSFNLGNAYFRTDQKGKAIFNYIEAQRLLPREDQIRANLDFTLSKTEDRLMPKNENAVTALFFWANDLNLREHGCLVLSLNLIFWLSMIAWHYQPISALDIVRKTALGFLLLSICGAGIRFYFDSQEQLAVVLTKTIQVVSSPGAEAKTLFELHEGAVIKILDHQGEWEKVSMGSGKTGWTRNDSLQMQKRREY
jgi:tetratricopeptide (TPR) repeat protein